MAKIETQTIQLHVIPHNPQFQVRSSGTDDFHVSQMAETYRQWVEDRADDPHLRCPIPPPVLFKVGGVYHLVAGFNRLAAMKAAGLTEAEFEVHLGVKMSDAAVYAAESNLTHTALKLKKEDVKNALLMYYDHVTDAKKTADTVLAKKFCVHRKTVRAWLEAHDDARKDQKDRTGADGKTKKTVAGEAKPTLFEEPKAEPPPEPEKQAEESGDVANWPRGPVSPPSPEMPPPRAEGEYPPDERFMPNAAEAVKICGTLSGVKAAMERVRADLTRLFPDLQHPVAKRIQFGATFEGDLTHLIRTIKDNLPEMTCPVCAGTCTVSDSDGSKCRSCDGYGLVSRGFAERHAAKWQTAGERYEKLAQMCDIAEVEA